MISMSREVRRLEKELSEVKATFNNLVNANTKLVDENKWLEEENKRLNNIINEFEKWLEVESQEHRFYYEHDKADTLDVALYKLQELKGSDKE